MERRKRLIEEAREGSVRAFELLLVGTEQKMLAVAASLAAYPDEADDIYQEAIFNAYRALPKFRADSEFSTWLYRIMVNTSLAYKRKLGNRFSRHAAAEQDTSAEDDAGLTEVYVNPDRSAANEELSRAIHNAVSALSDKEKVAFVLCHQQELSIADAAEIMDCSTGAVKSYLFRGREKLRQQLQEHQL